MARLALGQQIWKTDEPQLSQELRKTFHGSRPQRRLPLDLTIRAAVGEPLVIEARLAAGPENNQARSLHCRLESPEPLVEAIRHPLSAAVLREQFGRLGGTNYELRELDAHIDGQPMLPLSVLGKLRHALVDRLNAAAASIPDRVCASGPVLEKLKQTLAADNAADRTADEPGATLHVLCHSLSQLEGVLAAGARSTLVDFQDIREYARAVELAHRAGADDFACHAAHPEAA